MTPKFMLLNVAACAALTVSAATDASTHRQAPDPVANPSAVVRQGNARFTVLTPEMIRVEYSPSGKFEDKATFAVVNRVATLTVTYDFRINFSTALFSVF